MESTEQIKGYLVKFHPNIKPTPLTIRILVIILKLDSGFTQSSIRKSLSQIKKKASSTDVKKVFDVFELADIIVKMKVRKTLPGRPVVKYRVQRRIDSISGSKRTRVIGRKRIVREALDEDDCSEILRMKKLRDNAGRIVILQCMSTLDPGFTRNDVIAQLSKKYNIPGPTIIETFRKFGEKGIIVELPIKKNEHPGAGRPESKFKLDIK